MCTYKRGVLTAILLLGIIIFLFYPTGQRVVYRDGFYYPQRSHFFIAWHDICGWGCRKFTTETQTIESFSKNETVIWMSKHDR